MGGLLPFFEAELHIKRTKYLRTDFGVQNSLKITLLSTQRRIHLIIRKHEFDWKGTRGTSAVKRKARRITCDLYEARRSSCLNVR